MHFVGGTIDKMYNQLRSRLCRHYLDVSFVPKIKKKQISSPAIRPTVLQYPLFIYNIQLFWGAEAEQTPHRLPPQVVSAKPNKSEPP